MLALIHATTLKIFRVNAPAPENAVYQDHDGKNIAKFDRYVGQETFVDEEVCAETDKENRHGSAQNDERGTQAAPVAEMWHNAGCGENPSTANRTPFFQMLNSGEMADCTGIMLK
jgi:hypothetical protein